MAQPHMDYHLSRALAADDDGENRTRGTTAAFPLYSTSPSSMLRAYNAPALSSQPAQPVATTATATATATPSAQQQASNEAPFPFGPTGPHINALNNLSQAVSTLTQELIDDSTKKQMLSPRQVEEEPSKSMVITCGNEQPIFTPDCFVEEREKHESGHRGSMGHADCFVVSSNHPPTGGNKSSTTFNNV